MSYPVPTLAEAVQRARERNRAELPGTDAAIWPNTQAVAAKVLGGEAFELYGFLQWIARQKFATSADGDMLDAIGEQYGVGRRPATYAAGHLTVTGTPLYTLTQGQRLARADDLEYIVDADTAIGPSGQASVPVTAAATGPDYNLEAAAALTLTRTTDEVTAIVTDANGIGGGFDTEDHESYRARILFRLRYPPHGGAVHDYVAWALSIPGVTRVWVDALAYGPGTVGVWFVCDNNGSAYGIPRGTDVEAVQDFINAVKPVTARVLVRAPEPAPIAVRLSGITNPTTALQGRIKVELLDVLRRDGQCSMPNAPFTLRPNLLWQAVARATGDAVHAVDVPALPVLMPVGYLPVLGAICYV